MENKDDFIDWYKKSLKAFKPEPPLESWKEIERKLEIDEIWDNIHSDLDYLEEHSRYYSYTKFFETTLLIAALSLLFIFPIVENKKDFAHKKNNQRAQQHEKIDNIKNELGDANSSKKNINSRSEIDGENAHSSTVDRIRNSKGKARSNSGSDEHPIVSNISERGNSTPGNKVKPNILLGDKKNEITKQPPLNLQRKNIDKKGTAFLAEAKGFEAINHLNLFGTSLIPSSADNNLLKANIARVNTVEIEVPINERNTAFQTPVEFTIGVTGAYKNHWLLNRTTFNGLSSEELNTTLPTFGKSFGMLAGVKIHSRIAIQTELNYSEEGQNYKDYINGRYTEKTINLRYYNLSVLLKYRVQALSAFSQASSSNILLGVYNSHLYKAEEQIEKKTINVLNDYKPYDLGILMGYEYGYSLSKSLLISTGIRVKYGLTNIYSGDRKLPSSFNITKNGSVDLSLSIQYSFQKK